MPLSLMIAIERPRTSQRFIRLATKVSNPAVNSFALESVIAAIAVWDMFVVGLDWMIRSARKLDPGKKVCESTRGLWSASGRG